MLKERKRAAAQTAAAPAPPKTRCRHVDGWLIKQMSAAIVRSQKESSHSAGEHVNRFLAISHDFKIPRRILTWASSASSSSSYRLEYLRRLFTISFCFSSLSRLGGRGRQLSWKKRSCAVLFGWEGSDNYWTQRDGNHPHPCPLPTAMSTIKAVQQTAYTTKHCPAHLYSGCPLKLQI